MATTDMAQERNDTAIYDIALTLADGATPVDLTGVALLLEVRRRTWDAAPLLTCTLGAGLALVSAPAGTLTWTLTAAQTLTLVPSQPGSDQSFVWALGAHTDASHVPLTGTLTIRANALSEPA